MQEFWLFHDKECKYIIEHIENMWSIDQKATYDDLNKLCGDKDIDTEVDSVLHMVISAFLEGEAKVLAETTEVEEPDEMDMHKSGLEVWCRLRYNFDRTSAFNVITVFECSRTCSPPRACRTYCRKSTPLKDDIRSTTARPLHPSSRNS
jgi:hypothetical protein